ncbi:MAG: beta-galactosidase trimerization domain-containing protein, partial [Armatimonadota bacterium]
PWGDYLIEVLAEAMKMFPAIVGYSFDGIHDSGVCYCDYCRAAYKKDTGNDIPDPNMNDPEFRRYEQWLNRRMEAFVVKLQTRLKAINPDFALVTWTTNAGRFGHFLSIPRNMPARMNLLFDSPGQEYWLDETNRGNTVVPAFANAYIWAVTNHRHAHSEPYLMSHGNPYGTDSFPPHELYRRVLLTITHGAQMALARGWTNLREATRIAFDEIHKRYPWLTHKKPEPWAAMVMSDDTNFLYGRDPGKVEERYLSNVLGTFRATLEEHLPTAVICDWNLNPEDLAPYKVLVLPNTACLTEQQAESIREYVRNGGGLVATVDASLFDEFGNPRKDFLLSDVLGVHYKGTPSSASGGSEIDVNFAKGIVDPSYWEKRKKRFRLQDHFRSRGGALRRAGAVCRPGQRYVQGTGCSN